MIVNFLSGEIIFLQKLAMILISSSMKSEITEWGLFSTQLSYSDDMSFHAFPYIRESEANVLMNFERMKTDPCPKDENIHNIKNKLFIAQNPALKDIQTPDLEFIKKLNLENTMLFE